MPDQEQQSGLPAKFYTKAKLFIDSNGQPMIKSESQQQSLTKIESFAQVDIAFADYKMFYHYFHFCELLLTAAYILFQPGRNIPIGRVFVGTQHWCNASQNNVQRKLIEAVLLPHSIVEGRLNTEAAESDAVLHIDRYYPIDCIYNKFLEPCLAKLSQPFKTVKHRVWNFVGQLSGEALEASTTRKQNVIFVQRDGKRHLVNALKERLFALCPEIVNVDFAANSWEDQVLISSSTAIMIGVHGNGLTNLLWMPANSTVIEIFPSDFHTYDYQFFAELAGHRYFGFEGKQKGGYIYTNGSRVGGYYGKEDERVDELPLDKLALVLEQLKT